MKFQAKYSTITPEVVNGIFKDAKTTIKEKGLRNFIGYLAHYLRRMLFIYDNSYYIYETPYSYNPAISRKVENIVGSLATRAITSPDELDSIISAGYDISANELTAQQCRERLARGAIMFCSFKDKELTSSLWIAMNDSGSRGFRLYPAPLDYGTAAFVGGGFTIPKYRGKGLYNHAVNEASRYFGEKGISIFVSENHKKNKSSQRTLRRMGTRLGGEGRHIRLLTLLNFKWISGVKSDSSKQPLGPPPPTRSEGQASQNMRNPRRKTEI
jgi:RimJ/RimL family protein N-acetyltransferase